MVPQIYQLEADAVQREGIESRGRVAETQRSGLSRRWVRSDQESARNEDGIEKGIRDFSMGEEVLDL